MAGRTKKAERYSIFKATGERCGGAEAYGSAMKRLKTARGRAQDQTCEVCGGAWKVDQHLNRWRLIPGTPEERIQVAPKPGSTEHTGPEFSAEPSDYRVECPRCTAENAGRAYLGHEVNKGTGKPRGKKAAAVKPAAAKADNGRKTPTRRRSTRKEAE